MLSINWKRKILYHTLPQLCPLSHNSYEWNSINSQFNTLELDELSRTIKYADKNFDNKSNLFYQINTRIWASSLLRWWNSYLRFNIVKHITSMTEYFSFIQQGTVWNCFGLIQFLYYFYCFIVSVLFVCQMYNAIIAKNNYLFSIASQIDRRVAWLWYAPFR